MRRLFLLLLLSILLYGNTSPRLLHGASFDAAGEPRQAFSGASRQFHLIAAAPLAPTIPALEQIPVARENAPASSPADPAPTAGSFCSGTDAYAKLLSQVTSDSWTGWIRKLSGAEPMLVNTVWVTNTTRFSPALFDGRSPAYDFVREQVLSWYPASQVEEPSYNYRYLGEILTWKNLVLTIPGTQHPDEIVVLSAHLDTVNGAPGADDNGTGSATLLEAARVLRANPLPRTLRIIWFTGEEQGLIGSQAYVQSHPLTGIVGVINLDMFGYDGDNDRCFELHVGGLGTSDLIGRCFVQAATESVPGLEIGYITTLASGASDHASFWSKGIPALEVSENFAEYTADIGCYGDDESPYYHRPGDTFANLSLPFGYDVARAALASTFALASSRYPAKFYFPMVSAFVP